ncbi:MAG TPA: hypothetical protein EYQ24_14490 [Bacteroidetes bacterium]|nr:hypothetical protein [Bacteroidota bacterium]
MSDRPTDADRPDADLPEEDVSAEDPPQAGTFFLEDEAPDEALKKDAAAFDRVQTRTEDVNEHEIETENEREYNRRYVREHGDHHGHEGEIDSPPAE